MTRPTGSRSVFDQRVYAQASAPADQRQGNLWVDTSAGNDLRVFDGTEWKSATPSTFGVIDRAESFTESGLTVGTSSATVFGGNVELLDTFSGTLQAPDSTYTTSESRGMKIRCYRPIDTVSVEVNGSTSGFSYISIDDDNGDAGVLASYTANGNSGETHTFTGLGLQANTTYRVVVEGADYTSGETSTDSTTTATNAGDVVGSSFGGSDFGGTACFRQIDIGTTETTSGSVTVEWPQPADVFDWDAASYQRTLAGETVDVYLEESTDGGNSWTEVSGPIGRGDEIPVDPADRVRFRADLARASTGNVPQLKAAYRRYKV